MYTGLLRKADRFIKAMAGHCSSDGGGGSGHCDSRDEIKMPSPPPKKMRAPLVVGWEPIKRTEVETPLGRRLAIAEGQRDTAMSNLARLSSEFEGVQAELKELKEWRKGMKGIEDYYRVVAENRMLRSCIKAAGLSWPG